MLITCVIMGVLAASVVCTVYWIVTFVRDVVQLMGLEDEDQE